MDSIFTQALPRGQPDMIVALASQGLSASEISTQLGLDVGIVLNVLKGDHPTPEEVSSEEAAQIKKALLIEAESTEDPYLRTKIRLELYSQRPSARRLKAAAVDAAATNFQVIQNLLVNLDDELLRRDRTKTIDIPATGCEPSPPAPTAAEG